MRDRNYLIQPAVPTEFCTTEGLIHCLDEQSNSIGFIRNTQVHEWKNVPA